MIAFFNLLCALVGVISAALTAAGVIGWMGVFALLSSIAISVITYKVAMHYALHKLSKESSK